ncbi:hypothetical protein SDRG_16120 [Saprolegnia diclina VS20]|uniref:Uncharacterized protein n=1 Tax=Saprolegnia diclina (strain VS20) TaxID=1156394 RepID=T0PL15_SAPDV|nr:hypothetical protein SDRG_16120 [Saprolegnia diclina VS20]EQC26054.1 hypothetical protein SDRG_16120 [Saprolegnia diclina VS20]|eukprot:XP_008620539.1 hypothetical protein SDRG_16120 [Saprolegnia diclina VS20]
MILVVDSFLFARQCGAPTLLRMKKNLLQPKLLLYLPEALLLASASQPTIALDPYVGVLVEAIEMFNVDEVRHTTVGMTIFANVLDVMDRAGRCDVVRFEAIWTLLFPASLVGTRQLLHQRTLQDEVRARIATLVLALAPTLSAEHLSRPRYGGAYTSWEQPGLLAVEVLAIVDPTQVPSLLQRWLEAMDCETLESSTLEDDNGFVIPMSTFRDRGPARQTPARPSTLGDEDHEYALLPARRRGRARDPARKLYVPLAQLLAKVVPQHFDEMERIAQRCLAVIGDVRSRPVLPDMTDYVFDDIQLDASHCQLCQILVGFLHDGTQTTLDVSECKKLCGPARRCLDANRHRLELFRDGRRRTLCDVTKLQPKGGVSESQLFKHLEAQRRDAEDRARVVALETLLADAQLRVAHDGANRDDEATDQHRVKRQRRTTER